MVERWGSGADYCGKLVDAERGRDWRVEKSDGREPGAGEVV